MLKFGYYISKLLSCIGGNKYLIKYYQQNGMIIGEDTRIFSKIVSSEPYLISIGNHCTIATNVKFLTHDASIGALYDREKVSDLCGRISIGNNCFVGESAIILYGVSIADRVIVAAGSVVTKSIDSPGVIIGGNPAKIIGTVDEFCNEYEGRFYSLHGLDFEQRKNEILSNNRLIKR